MSRIGNKEIIYSEDVQVVMDGNIVKVKGPKGSLERTIPEGITINIDSGKINLIRLLVCWIIVCFPITKRLFKKIKLISWMISNGSVLIRNFNFKNFINTNH